MRPTALIVMEPGGDWPQSLSREDVDVVVLGHDPRQPEEALHRRACERAERMKEGIALAVLACNEEVGDGAMERRVRVARALLAAILRAGRGRLVFSAKAKAPPALKQELRGLAATLLEGLQASPASVSVLLDSDTTPTSVPQRNSLPTLGLAFAPGGSPDTYLQPTLH